MVGARGGFDRRSSDHGHLLAVTFHTLGVGTVERHADKELRGHASALAGIELPARCTGARRLGLAHLGEQFALTPDRGEPALVANVAGLEIVVENERAGVYVADRIDQTHHSTCPTQVEPRKRLAESRQVEERIAGEHIGALDEPVV